MSTLVNVGRRDRMRQLLRSWGVLQSPMAGAQDYRMAAATYRAGGLGAIPMAMLTPAEGIEQVKLFRDDVKDQTAPLNLNFFCHEELMDDLRKKSVWMGALSKYCEELNLDPKALNQSGAFRRAFNQESFDMVLALKPRVVSFHFGLPKDEFLESMRTQLPETFILCSATNLQEAQWLDEKGVDAIILQGLESGGHRGMFLKTSRVETQMGLLSLIQQTRGQLPSIPLIAAGGICDERTVRAARELGVDAVQVGTCLLLSDEGRISKIHKEAIRSRKPTAITNVFTGKPARSVVNRLQTDLGFMNYDVVPDFPFAAGPLAPLKAASEKLGRPCFTALWSGQSGAGPWTEESSSQVIVESLRASWLARL